MIFCSKCQTNKSPDEFSKNKHRPNGKSIYCKPCMAEVSKVIRKRNNTQRTEYNKKYRNENRKAYNQWERNYHDKNRQKHDLKSKKWRETEVGLFRTMHLSAKDRAKKKGIEYELSPTTIRAIYEIQLKKCALTGIDFVLSDSKEYKFRPFAPSIDRKDSKKGYTYDNIQMVCVIVNKAKNEYSQEIFDMMCMARAGRIDNA